MSETIIRDISIKVEVSEEIVKLSTSENTNIVNVIESPLEITIFEDTLNLSVDEEINQVNVVEETVSIIEIISMGPQGPPGPSGSGGGSIIDGIFSPTGSYYYTPNNLIISGSITAPFFIGDGSLLTNIPSSSGAGFPFIGNAEITGSLVIKNNDAYSGDIFLIKSSSFNAISVNNKGVFSLGEFSTLPTAVTGSIVHYSGSYYAAIF